MLKTNKTFQTAISKAIEQFQPHYQEQSLIWQLIFYYSNKVKTVSSYLTHALEPIDFDYTKFVFDLQKIFLEKKPLARITGKTNFYGAEFQVEERIFIPRHETELVVDTTVQALKTLNKTNASYIDLCTGTGNIGLSVLRQLPNLPTTLIDLNPLAVYNAQKNAEHFGFQPKLVVGNWVDYLKNHPQEIITANFPYVAFDDYYQPELIKYENSLSLFAEDCGWEHYGKLIKYLLLDDHWQLVVLETSPFHQKKWLVVKSRYPKWNISFINDLNNLFRVVKITRK